MSDGKRQGQIRVGAMHESDARESARMYARMARIPSAREHPRIDVLHRECLWVEVPKGDQDEKVDDVACVAEYFDIELGG